MTAEIVTEVAGLRIVLRLDSSTVLRQMLMRVYFSIENIETTPIALSDTHFARPHVQWCDSNFEWRYQQVLRRSRRSGAPAGVQRQLAPGEIIEEYPLVMVQGWGARVALQVDQSEYGTGEIVGGGIDLKLEEAAPPEVDVHVGQDAFAEFHRPELAEGPLYYQEQHSWVASDFKTGGSTNEWMEAPGTRVALHPPAGATHLWEWECIAGWVNYPAVAFLHSCRH